MGVQDYVAIAPCLWGYQPGLPKPITFSPETNLTAIKYFNNTYRHMGQMAQWTTLDCALWSCRTADTSMI